MARYKNYDQSQLYMVSFDPDSNFPEGSFVRFLNNFIEKHFKIRPFAKKRKNDKNGAPAKHAKMMLKVIFYAFTQGIYSMREVANECLPKRLDFIYLSGYQMIHHSTLSRFLNYYQEEITKLFTIITYVAREMGYINSELIAIDGCKLKAYASKKFTGNLKTFIKKKNIYEKMIINLIERAKRLETKENEGELKKENYKKEQNRIDRLKCNYTNAIEKIDAFIAECEESEDKELARKTVNLTDRDSPLVEKDQKYFQGYNCQAGSNDYRIIVSNDVSDSASDRCLTEKGLKKVVEHLRASGMKESEIKKIIFLMDKGYNDSEAIGNIMRKKYKILIPFHSRDDLDNCKKVNRHQCTLEKEGKKYILTCPGGQRMESCNTRIDRGVLFYGFYTKRALCTGCKYAEKCIKGLKNKKVFRVKKEVCENLREINELKERMTIPEEKDKYNKRFGMIEPVFGIIQEHRKFKGFLVRGIGKVKLHWNIICSAFNLRRLHVLLQG